MRLNGFDGIASPVVVINEEHRFMAAEQLRLIDVSPRSIILEPVGRNTAPAIAVAALKIMAQNDDPILLVLPADHVIIDTEKFYDALSIAANHAEKGNLITFGIVPASPEIGYGYIQKGESSATGDGVCTIQRFVEKPDLDTAMEYVDSGDYYWNSGMFMFKVSAILKELETHAPEMVAACTCALEGGEGDLDFFRLHKESFASSPSDSIDYAVMEKTSKGLVVPLNAGWDDLGSWDALWQTGKKDENQNVIIGDVLVEDVRRSYLHAESRLLAAVGLDDHVVVETRDAVLVAARDKVQDVKKLVQQLRNTKREEAVSHSRVYRPWGDYETVDLANRFQVKRITVKPGAKLSLQKHYHRAEHWTVVSGTAIITKGEDEILLKEDESTYIPLGHVHRIENPGRIPLELIEIQSGSYLGEDDIVRLDDVYGRSKGE